MTVTDFSLQLPGEPEDIDFDYDLPPGPFVHSRSVGWSDTDPAQIVFTGQVPGMALDAYEAWLKAVIGVNWYELNLDHSVGMPFVHLSCDFKSPITPRSKLLLPVFVEKIGRSSLSMRVEGHQDERFCFTSSLISTFVRSRALKTIPIPTNIRANIERYQSRQDG